MVNACKPAGISELWTLRQVHDELPTTSPVLALACHITIPGSCSPALFRCPRQRKREFLVAWEEQGKCKGHEEVTLCCPALPWLSWHFFCARSHQCSSGTGFCYPDSWDRGVSPCLAQTTLAPTAEHCFLFCLHKPRSPSRPILYLKHLLSLPLPRQNDPNSFTDPSLNSVPSI